MKLWQWIVMHIIVLGVAFLIGAAAVYIIRDQYFS